MIEVLTGDCLEVMRGMETDSVDLIITSPPYENAREYGEVDFGLQGQEWVDWAVERYVECDRVCKGLVAWVVEGKTKNFRWTATPALLMTDLHRRGISLRKPCAFVRQGISGGGGPDFWRNDWEFAVVSSKGKLPWSENIATGKPCKYPGGGAFSNRSKDGSRANPDRKAKGNNGRPPITNPGNVLSGNVGKGHMGSNLAHVNEAPFPEWLVEPFVRCFCPFGGRVLDPFGGSGTTAAVATKWGRNAVSIDVRPSQRELTLRRVEEVTG